MTHSCRLALLLAALAPSLVCAVEPPAPNKADGEAVAKVRKAAEMAEVHGVGVSCPEHERLGHVKDWPLLAAILRTKKGPAGRVWELLSDESRKRLSDDALVLDLRAEDRGQNPIRGSVAAELRKIQDNPDFYTEAAFKDVPLTKDLKDLIALGKKRTAYQTALLNYALLDKALPGCIPELPANFRTIKVDVLAGNDVVLVLSSSEHCRWQVALREGARVTGVILCGYYPGEVVGVDAPVVYRCYYEPNGATVARGYKYFCAYDEKKEEFKELLAGVKDITGKEFTKFQGEGRPGPFSEPYTIRPKGGK